MYRVSDLFLRLQNKATHHSVKPKPDSIPKVLMDICNSGTLPTSSLHLKSRLSGSRWHEKHANNVIAMIYDRAGSLCPSPCTSVLRLRPLPAIASTASLTFPHAAWRRKRHSTPPPGEQTSATPCDLSTYIILRRRSVALLDRPDRPLAAFLRNASGRK